MESGPPGASRLTEAAAEALRSYDWPGNVRELRNVVERACILSQRDPIDAPLIQGILARPQLLETAAQADLHIRRRVEALERELIAEALGRTGGRKRDAAALLGIDPKNFGYYLRKHDVAAEEDGEP
jgi:DNA-binding NtrC family response regulator